MDIAEVGLGLFEDARPGQLPRSASPRADLLHAQQLLAAAPTELPPVEVARYFAQLRAVGSLGYRFSEDWPSAAGCNPVILAFRSGPGRRSRAVGPPSPDACDWAAGFVNWCLDRGGCRALRNPGSRSFRSWVIADRTPVVGDLAVFADVDAERQLLPSGHVAFWLHDHGDAVQVLGAVQRFGGPCRIAEVPMRRLSVDPTGRIFRRFLGTVPIAALQHSG
jgi:hypothetical protein